MSLQFTVCVIGWWEGGWTSHRNGKSQKPEKCSKNAPRTHRQLHALLARLQWLRDDHLFLLFRLLRNHFLKISMAIMVDVPMEPNSNSLVSMKNYF
jgi:hypothetical protein